MADAMPAEALWIVAPRKIERRAESAPAPAPGEVRIQAIASALSHGTEMLVYRGELPAELELDLPTLAGSFAYPIKYGYAAVGRVIDAGADVEGLALGDPVFALHPHQTVFTLPAGLVTKLPAGIDPLLGVFSANLETAVNILLDTPLRLGETVVVFGLGTVGLLVVQLLRLAGAGQVIAVDPLEQRRALALSLGCDLALAPHDRLADAIRELTAGRGADVAIEVSGAPSALPSAIDCVAVDGTVVVASWYGSKPVSLALGGHFHRGRVRLRSSQVGRLNPELGTRWDNQRRMATVQALLPRLRLTELISHQIPFVDAADAWRLVDTHPEDVIQVVLTYPDAADRPGVRGAD
jgi:2-desacetyl-2-hydroxyethyl bacteriochlorophyllide A dehydrogenase